MYYNISREEFFNREVIRNNGIAEIIFDYDHLNRPVRLIGFKTDAELQDIDILIEGWDYYNRLLEEITNILKK